MSGPVSSRGEGDQELLSVMAVVGLILTALGVFVWKRVSVTATAPPGAPPTLGSAAAGVSDPPSGRPGGGAEAGGEEIAALAAEGAQLYAGRALCFTCHQSHGKGVAPIYPPLRGSPWVTGSAERAVLIVLHGLSGPMEIGGVEYGKPPAAPMTPLGTILSDRDIAAVLTFVRTNAAWGNHAPAVSESFVAKVRSRYGARTELWSTDELLALFPLELEDPSERP